MWTELLANRDHSAGPGPMLLVEETAMLAQQIEDLYYTSVSGDWLEGELDEPSHDLEETTGRLTELVNSGTDAPQINVRVRRIVNWSRRLIPNILFLVAEDAVNLDLSNHVRDDLAIIEALTRALPESKF
jgi:hypothetical protein